MFRHLVSASLGLFLLAPAAEAQCTKDIECKGDRICVRGECVDPLARGSTNSEAAPATVAPQASSAAEAGPVVAPAAAAANVPPAQPAASTVAPEPGRKLTAREIRERARAASSAHPSATAATPPAAATDSPEPQSALSAPETSDSSPSESSPDARLNALSFHPLMLLGGMIIGAQNGVSTTLLVFEYARSVVPNVSAYGRVGTMNVASGGVSVGGFVFGGGARLQLEAAGLRGAWVGGGFTTASVGVLSQTNFSVLAGYTFEYGGFFFAPSAGMTLQPGSGTNPVSFAIEAPIGLAF